MNFQMNCKYCRQKQEITILEIYPETRSWQADYCCETLQAECSNDQTKLYPLLKMEGLDIRDCCDNELNFKIQVHQITLAAAKEFINKYHRHNKPPVGHKFSLGAYNGQTLVGVLTAGRPVARAYNGKGILEVNRVCINPGIKKELTFNACSKLYAAARPHAKRLKEKYTKIITYIRADENGSSLRASNFIKEADVKGRPYIRNGINRHYEIINKARYSINI